MLLPGVTEPCLGGEGGVESEVRRTWTGMKAKNNTGPDSSADSIS